MIESKTSLYDFAESLKTPEKMATSSVPWSGVTQEEQPRLSRG
jgi:hypothetical protein